MAYKTRVFFFFVRLFSQSKRKTHFPLFFQIDLSRNNIFGGFLSKRVWSSLMYGVIICLSSSIFCITHPHTHTFCAHVIVRTGRFYRTFFPTTPLGIVGIRGIALPQLRALAKPLDAVESRRSNRVIRIAFSFIYLPLFFFCRIASLD